MKKQILLGAAVLSSSVLLLTPLSAQAASSSTIKIYKNCQSNSNSQSISNCNNNSNCKSNSTCLSNSNCQSNSNCLSNSTCKSNSNIILSKNSCFSIKSGSISLPDLSNCVIGGVTLPDYICPNQDAKSCPASDVVNGNACSKNLNLPETNQPETSSPATTDVNVPTVPVKNQSETVIPVKDIPESNNTDTTLSSKDEAVTPAEDNTAVANTDTDQSSFMKQVVSLVNIERAKNGLAPLTIESNMEKAANIRSREIQKSFAHTRPDGSSFSTALRDAGVSYKQCGENIAWGQKTPTEVMNGWMNSSGHRANILNKSFTRIGVGYTENSSGTGYWVQLFAN